VDEATWDEIYDQFSGIENRQLRSRERFPDDVVPAFSQRGSTRTTKTTTMTQFPGTNLSRGMGDPVSQEVVR
jgi:hypothetical protein